MVDGDGRPTSELGPSGPVCDDAVLAAVARAERLEGSRVNMRDIAQHLGWRYTGAATVRLRPPLARLVASDLLSSTDPAQWRIRSKKWGTTVAGRRRLASADPVELPESPQHRRWRQDRDVATWALDGLRAEAQAVLDQADALLREPPAEAAVTGAEVQDLILSFRAAVMAYALAAWMCSRWPEPTDDGPGPDPGAVADLLPDHAERSRRV